jgi:serine/threonine-protein kinase
VSESILSHDRYEVLDLLGSGGMASVYRGRDRETERIVAIKIMDKRLAHRSEVLRRFELEADAMDRLKHPHIVPLHDVHFEGDTRFIVMDFIDGESLLDKMERAVLAPAEAVAVLIPVLDALQMAHENGVVHRDIKPHNILISKEGRVYVSDFGIARIVDDTDMSLTRTGMVMGTWAFMAPEQRADAKGVDALADIYSVGSTLFAAVTGKTPNDLFAAELDPSIYKGVPKPIESVIRKACAYWTTDRYPTAQAMGADLELTLQMLKTGRTPADFRQVKFRTDPAMYEDDHMPRPTPPPAPPPRPAEASPPPLVGNFDFQAREHRQGIDRNALFGVALVAVVLAGMLFWMAARTVDTVAPAEVVAVNKEAPVPERSGRMGATEDGFVPPEKPELSHEPPAAVGMRETLRLMAEITGSDVYDQVQAWYRPRGSAEWSRTGMRRVGSEYHGSIDVTPLFAEGLEYWIEAKPYHKGVPPLSHGSARRPVRLMVMSR